MAEKILVDIPAYECGVSSGGGMSDIFYCPMEGVWRILTVSGDRHDMLPNMSKKWRGKVCGRGDQLQIFPALDGNTCT